MNKTVTVEISIHVIRQLGLAVENEYDEEEQRRSWGDETIDWINAVHNTHEEDLKQHTKDLNDLAKQAKQSTK